MSDISNQAAQAASDAVMSKVATGMTVGGGGTAFVGGLTLNEFAMIFGMLIGLLGLFLQLYQTLHKRRVYVAEHDAIKARTKREEEEHNARMGMYL